MKASSSVQLVVGLLLLGVGTLGCGGGGGTTPVEASPDVLAEAMTDAQGVAVLNVGGTEHRVLVEDDLSGRPIDGLRVAGAVDATGGALLVVDEAGSYPSVFSPFGTAAGGGAAKQGGVSILSDDGTISIRLPSADTEGTAGLLYTMGEIGDEARAMLTEWAEESGLAFEWSRRVPLSELEHTLLEFRDEVAAPWIFSLAHDPISPVGGWVATLMAYLPSLEMLGEDIVYRGFIRQCYSPETMVTLYQVGPLTLHVIPDGPAPTRHSDDAITLRGTATDSLSGDPLTGVALRLWPTEETATTDSTGAYAFEGVVLGCQDVDEIEFIATLDGYADALFTNADLDLGGALNDVRIFDFTLKEIALTNVALSDNGGTALAVSEGSYLGMKQWAWYANDGLVGQYSWSSQWTMPAWLQIAFDKTYTVHQVGVHWSSHQHTFTISLSADGTTWTTVVGPQLGNSTEGVLPETAEYYDVTPPMEAAYIRVDMTTTSAPGSHIFQASVMELEAWAR